MWSARPGSKPAWIGSAAITAASHARPAITTSAPASSAVRNGSTPIWATMRVAASTSGPVSARSWSSGRTRPAATWARSQARSTSASITAVRKR